MAVGPQLLSCLLIAGRKDVVEKMLRLQKGKEAPVQVSCSGQCWGVPAAPSVVEAEMAGREQACFANTNPALSY